MAKSLLAQLGKLLRTSLSLLLSPLFGILIIGGLFASVGLSTINTAVSNCAASNDPICRHRKIITNLILGSKLPTLTIFTAPTRPFSNSSDDPQYQALLSWLNLVPTPRIVLLGNDTSFYKVFEQLNGNKVSIEPNIDRNLRGTVQVHSMFARAQQADTDISLIIDANTLLLQDFMEALHKTHEAHQNWLFFGRHWDMNGEAFPISFAIKGSLGLVEMTSRLPGFPTNCKEIADLVRSQGSLQSSSEAVDYWAWNNNNKPNSIPLLTAPIPPFSHVTGTYESWILQHLSKEANKARAIVDASEAIASVRIVSNSAIKVSSSTTTAWEAYINAMLSREGNGHPSLSSIAQWKLIPCAEAKVQNLCMVQQKKQGSSNLKVDDGGYLSSNGARLEQLMNLSTNPVWKKTAPGLPHTRDELLPQVADENRVVVMVGGTSNYKEMLLSFVCRAQSLGVKNVLIAAFDEALFEYAYMQGLPVYLEGASEDYRSLIGSDGQCIFASECFKHVSKLKSWSVLRVLRKGYSVLWSDMDIVWFQNPLPQLLALGPGTLPIQSDEPNENLPENNIRGANSGFYLARAEEKTIRAFEAIVGHAMGTDTTEQPSFYDILCGEKGERRVGNRECTFGENGIRTIFLSHEKFPNGFVFRHWDTQDPSMSCKNKGCVLLHNNFIAGKDNKLIRLVMHGLWFYDISNRMCLQPWHPLSSNHASLSTFQIHFLHSLNISLPIDNSKRL